MFLESVSLWHLTESHLCLVDHLCLQRAGWERMFIRYAHLRINLFEYYMPFGILPLPNGEPGSLPLKSLAWPGNVS
jgi:hypothetical protein